MKYQIFFVFMMGKIFVFAYVIWSLFAINLTMFASSSSIICKPGNYILRQQDTLKCLPCLVCPGGLEPREKCGSLTIYSGQIEGECVSCPSGYYSSSHGFKLCERCRLCMRFKVDLPCRAD